MDEAQDEGEEVDESGPGTGSKFLKYLIDNNPEAPQVVEDEEEMKDENQDEKDKDENQDGDTTESGDIISTQDEELQSNIRKRKKKLQKVHAKADKTFVEKENVEEDEDEDDELQSDEEEPGETEELQPTSLQEYFK